MPDNPEKQLPTEELKDILSKDIHDLMEFARNAARRAQETLQRAEAINNAAEEKQVRAQKEDGEGGETEGERVTRMSEDLDDKASTHRAISALARVAEHEARKAAKAAEGAEKKAGNLVEQEEVAKLQREVEEAKAAAAAASALADRTKLAADAAETIGQLAVFGFVDKQKDLIFERLKECHEIAQESGGTALFIAQSLPIINGIIYVGSSQDNLNRAIDWVKSRWGRADAQIVLSALVFRYIADIGLAKFKDTPEEAVWDDITKKVEKLRFE